MNKYLDLINDLEEENNQPQPERYLLIDGLNLFFRNFTMINSVNSKGVHIGGLGGFFRSLGYLINQIQPTKIFVVFDGEGGSVARKNIISEYKSNRNLERITNWDVFENMEEEDSAKVDQITRVIQYLKTLPVKVLTLPKTEADDVIAYLSKVLIKNENERVFIASADHDFLQLVTDQVFVWLARRKTFFTPKEVLDNYFVLPENFLIHKTLVGDQSDNIKGIKGIGKKGLIKKFPQLNKKPHSLDDIYKISVDKEKEHTVYKRIVREIVSLKDSYKVMDLNNPMLNLKEKEYLDFESQNFDYNFHPQEFIKMWEEDELGKLIRNVDQWVIKTFEQFV